MRGSSADSIVDTRYLVQPEKEKEKEIEEELAGQKVDIREKLREDPEFGRKLPVELWVRPGRNEVEFPITGIWVDSEETSDGWIYHVDFGDEKDPRMTACMDARIRKVRVQSDIRNSLYSACYENNLQRKSKEREQKRKHERILSQFGDPDDRAFVENLMPKIHWPHTNATDPQLGNKLVREVIIAYLEGYPLRKSSDAINPPKSAFEVAGEKLSKKASTIENQYYRWLK